jgi:hypothetical protein
MTFVLKGDNQLFVKRYMEVHRIDLWREICKPVLKIGFYGTWHNRVTLQIWSLWTVGVQYLGDFLWLTPQDLLTIF